MAYRQKTNKTIGQDARNLLVQKWGEWATDLGMQVQIEYWGGQEIWNRLMKDEHHGRLLFGYSEWCFSSHWLRQRIEVAHKNAGKRYMSSLHVALDPEHRVDALDRSDEIFRRFSDRLGSGRHELDNVGIDRFGTTASQEAVGELNRAVRELSGTRVTTQTPIEPLPLVEVARLADRGWGLAFRFVAALQDLMTQGSDTPGAKGSYSYEHHHLYLLQDRFAGFDEFARSPQAIVTSTSILLLVGDSGTGKRYLFYGAAHRRWDSIYPPAQKAGRVRTANCVLAVCLSPRGKRNY